MIKPVTDFYSGPAIVAHEDLVAYYTADEGSGTELSDLTTNNLHSDLEGGTAWTTGRFGQALSLDGNNDFVSIESKGKLNELHRSSYSISLWINPSVASSGLYNSGQLRIHGYQVAMSDSYFSNLSSLLIYRFPEVHF